MIDRGGLMVVGATSGAGKSTVAAALCRSLVRSGRSVAPFKAQNMSNHAAVTADGGEVGRAQAMQALAARVPLERRMNPVLLKPTSDLRSHLIVMGDEVSVTDAADYGVITAGLRPTVLDAITSLRRDHEWVVAEGAGGAAEINLLDRDLVNLPLAHAAGIPAILIVDIERGGAFASAHGTIDLLPPELRATIKGVVFNQFRGDPSLLTSGILELEARSGVAYLGTLPHLGALPMLGVEDSLDIRLDIHRPSARSARPLRVAAIRLPHLANPSDVDPLLIEDDVEFRWIIRSNELDAVDLVLVPGSRATVADLHWLRSAGFDRALAETSATVVGICAGYQMLGSSIVDDVESGEGSVEGLGLLDVDTTFQRPKLVGQRQASDGRHEVHGYDIRFGRPTVGARPWFTQLDRADLDRAYLDRAERERAERERAERERAERERAERERAERERAEQEGASEGARSADGRCFGTSLHGVFDADAFRWAFLSAVAERHGRSFEPTEPGWHVRLDVYHDTLADWIEQHLELERLLDIGRGAHVGAGW